MRNWKKRFEKLDGYEREYREILIDALRECADGRWGLLGHNEPAWTPQSTVRDELFERGAEIDALRRKLGLDSFELHAAFLARRGRQTANSLGEPKAAQAWLKELLRDP